MSNWMAEAAAEQHALGMSCSFDCARCEAKMSAHDHPSACGHPIGACYDEECYYEETTQESAKCRACQGFAPPPTATFDPDPGIPF